MAADGAATGVFSPLKALPGRTAPWVAGTLASAGFAVMVLFPILEAGVRRFTSWNFPSSAAWVQHLTLWLGILGAILASFLGRHLSIAVGEALRAPTLKRRLDIVGRGGAVGILSCLSWASLVLTRSQMASPETLGGWLPTWVAIASMPAGFAAMALATFWRSGEGWKVRGVLIALALMAGPLVALLPMGDGRILSVVGVVSLLLLAGGGMPLFAVLGGRPFSSFTWPRCRWRRSRRKPTASSPNPSFPASPFSPWRV